MTDSNICAPACPICAGAITEMPLARQGGLRSWRERLSRRYQCERCHLSFHVSIDEILLSKALSLLPQKFRRKRSSRNKLYIYDAYSSATDPLAQSYIPTPHLRTEDNVPVAKQPLFFDLRMSGFSIRIDVTFGKLPGLSNLAEWLRSAWGKLTCSDLKIANLQSRLAEHLETEREVRSVLNTIANTQQSSHQPQKPHLADVARAKPTEHSDPS